MQLVSVDLTSSFKGSGRTRFSFKYLSFHVYNKSIGKFVIRPLILLNIRRAVDEAKNHS